MAEIQRVSHKHTAIMDYIIANPTHKLGDVAKHFGMTQGWLSQIIHSDAFQAQLNDRQDAVFNETVLPLRAKMTNIAHQTLDRLAETIHMETEPKNLASIAESVLDRLGFSPKGNGNAPAPQQLVQVNVLRQEVESARSLLGTRTRDTVEVIVDGVRAPIGLSVPGAPAMGQTFEGTAVHAHEEV